MAEPTKVDPEKRYRVKVVVPARDGYPGFWAAGQLWRTGETPVEDMPGTSVQNIQGKKGNIAIVVLGEASGGAGASAAPAPGPTFPGDEDYESSPSKSRVTPTRK